jgi:hypothetical protein
MTLHSKSFQKVMTSHSTQNKVPEIDNIQYGRTLRELWISDLRELNKLEKTQMIQYTNNFAKRQEQLKN